MKKPSLQFVPKKIGNTAVEPILDSINMFRGNHWITLLPKDESDSRIWEYCIETKQVILTKKG